MSEGPYIDLHWRKTHTDGSWHSWFRDHLSRSGEYGRGTDHLEMSFGSFYSFSSFIGDQAQDQLSFTHRGQRVVLPGKKEGTQFTGRLHPASDWINYRIVVTEDQRDRMLDRAIKLAQGNHGYDWNGVARFSHLIRFLSLGFWKEHPDKYFCSEAVVDAMQAGDLMLGIEPWKQGPNHVKQFWRVP